MRTPQQLAANPNTVDLLLKALSGAVQERSVPLRRSFSTAVGYLFKLSTDETGMKFVEHLKNMYCENEGICASLDFRLTFLIETEHHVSAAWCFLEISKHSADRFKAVASIVLPVAYFGLHDQDEKVKNVWKDLWDGNTGAAGMAVKLYLKEILQFASAGIKSASWPVKIQAALTIADVASSLKSELDDHMSEILPLLLEALGGRTWPGKGNRTEESWRMSFR